MIVVEDEVIESRNAQDFLDMLLFMSKRVLDWTFRKENTSSMVFHRYRPSHIDFIWTEAI